MRSRICPRCSRKWPKAPARKKVRARAKAKAASPRKAKASRKSRRAMLDHRLKLLTKVNNELGVATASFERQCFKSSPTQHTNDEPRKMPKMRRGNAGGVYSRTQTSCALDQREAREVSFGRHQGRRQRAAPHRELPLRWVRLS